MNLKLIRLKKKTEDLLLSKTKNCETLIEQTPRKAEEKFDFKLDKSRKICRFNPPVEVKEDWMIGLTSLEIYKSFF